ncbi:MAG: ATP-binding protein [Bacteroidales bacterium]|jgi:predicted AAA+ superfamily ATPase|nr:ATP-binding protein [Bacteroidales bacterium]HOI31506.1 ATP-binding protein [Bacteroidales bacterium]
MILKNDIEHAFQAQQVNLQLNAKLIEREFLARFKTTGKHIEVISGIRRSGKSTLMKQIIQRKYKQTAYFNFEDARVFGFEVNDFTKLDEVIGQGIDAYFFDEIQNVTSWEVFVRQLHDRNEKVYITGSNATLLSKELGTKLTGRHIRHELFPFSYQEFLNYKQLEKNANAFGQFLLKGGFPEYLDTENPEVLQNMLKDIVLRDIAIRYSIRNTASLMDITLYLLSNIGKEFSYNKIRKNFHIGSANTVSDYLSWLADAYLFFFLPKFSWSARSIATNPRKVYAIDNGLVNANTLSFREDRGRLLENAVFMHLRQQKNSLFYFREQHECDFVVFENKQCKWLIQVCEELNKDNLHREIEGLKEAMAFFKITEGFILTQNQNDTLLLDGLKIHILPVYEFVTSSISNVSND